MRGVLELMATYLLPIVVVGGAYAFYRLRRRWMGRASEGWPSIYGTVEQAYATQERGSEMAVISYSYSVAGQYFAGFCKQAFPLAEQAKRFVARYPSQGKVLIRYHPDDPSRSVLRDQDQIPLDLLAAPAAPRYSPPQAQSPRNIDPEE